tara:strand:+ start:938 stop:1456 length:519 start_codon:yes stop_codon:yes gene_type:complete
MIRKREVLTALDVRFDVVERRGYYIYAVSVPGYKDSAGGIHLLSIEDAWSERSAWTSALIEVGSRVLLLLEQLNINPLKINVIVQGQRRDLPRLLDLAEGGTEKHIDNIARFLEVVRCTNLIVRHRDGEPMSREERLIAEKRMEGVFREMLAAEKATTVAHTIKRENNEISI